jgi:hypothetical protein
MVMVTARVLMRDRVVLSADADIVRVGADSVRERMALMEAIQAGWQ